LDVHVHGARPGHPRPRWPPTCPDCPPVWEWRPTPEAPDPRLRDGGVRTYRRHTARGTTNHTERREEIQREQGAQGMEAILGQQPSTRCLEYIPGFCAARPHQPACAVARPVIPKRQGSAAQRGRVGTAGWGYAATYGRVVATGPCRTRACVGGQHRSSAAARGRGKDGWSVVWSPSPCQCHAYAEQRRSGHGRARRRRIHMAAVPHVAGVRRQLLCSCAVCGPDRMLLSLFLLPPRHQ